MNKCPAIFEHYYNIKNIQYYTRQVGDLDVPPSRTGYGDRSLIVGGAKKWNNMDANMKPYRKKGMFEREIKGELYFTIQVWN